MPTAMTHSFIHGSVTISTFTSSIALSDLYFDCRASRSDGESLPSVSVGSAPTASGSGNKVEDEAVLCVTGRGRVASFDFSTPPLLAARLRSAAG